MPKRKTTILSTKEVAHILDCSPDEVALLAKKGKLKGIKKGSRWEFKVKDVEEYRRERE